MKKTILAMILAGSSAAVCAQDTTTMNDTRTDSAQNITGNQTSTGNYNAYGAANMPTTIQRNFQAQYPGASNAQWQQTFNGFWRATYQQNGQLMTIHYAPNGESFMVAVPVLQSGVPQDIVNRALELYGSNLYDITLVKQPNPEYVTRDSMMRAMSMSGNIGVSGTTDSAANMQGDVTVTGDTSNMNMNANANTYGTWGDTTSLADIPRTIDLYLVRIIDNGILRAQRMNADGSPDLAYGTTMAAPISGNVNINNMNQNNTTDMSQVNTAPPTYSAYYDWGSDSAGANISTGNYAAKDSAALDPTTDTTSAMPMTDTTSAMPMTDTTSSMPVTDTTATGGGIGTDTTAAEPVIDTTATSPVIDTMSVSPLTDTTTRPMTDTTGTGGGDLTDTTGNPNPDTTGTGSGIMNNGTGSDNSPSNEENTTTNDEAILQNQSGRYRFENQEKEQE